MASSGGCSTRAAARSRYEYLSLRQIFEQKPTLANVYAVVVDTSAPATTKTGDWKATFKLMDSSNLPGGVTAIIFAQRVELLPRPRVGDILRLHRAQVKEFQHQPQLSGKVMRGLSWSLYAGEIGSPCTPEARAPGGVQHTNPPDHAALLQAARLSAQSLTATNVSREPDQYRCSIAQLVYKDYWQADVNVDLVVRLLAAELPPLVTTNTAGGVGDGSCHEYTSAPTIWVWDGTEAIPTQTAVADGDDGAHRPQQVADMPVVALPGRHLVVASIPSHGTALPVSMDIKYQEAMPMHGANLLDTPVKLRNVQVSLDALGRLCVQFHRYSRWSKMSEDSVPRLDYQIQPRFEVEDQVPVGVSTLASQLVPPHPDRPFSSLRALRCSASSGFPGKFRCLAKVVGHWPADIEQFCSPKRNAAGEEEWVWTVKLFLADATGSIAAVLWGADADKFFSGARLQACDLFHNPEVLCRLREVVRRLTCRPAGGAELQEGGERQPQTWIECCVLSYFLDKDQPLETVMFRIFDTALWFPPASN